MRWLEPDAPSASGAAGLAGATGRSTGSLTEETSRSILEWNVRLGADPGLGSKWSAVRRGEGAVVVTGQQPALLGGPLYSAYKLATAVAIAEHLERASGRPTLAIFWIVGDDSDFGEVSSAWFAAEDGQLTSARDETVPPGGTCIGALESTRQEAVWRTLESSLPPRSAERLGSILRGVRARGARTWSETQAAILFGLLAPHRFLCIDGGDPGVLRAAQPFLRREEWERVLPSCLEQGAVEARSLGHEPAFEPELGRRARFAIEGDRRAAWEPRDAKDALLAPNVVLRPLLQDWLLPNVVTVCGSSEIRYRAQLGPVYRYAGVPEPIRWPRVKGLVVPAGIARRIGEEAIEGAVRDPRGFVAARARETGDAELLGETERFRAETDAGWRRLTERLSGLDSSLGQLAESARGKADFQLQRVRESLEAKLRQRARAGAPWLAHWGDLVLPRGREQERVLSCLTFPAWGERAPGDALLELARSDLARRFDGSGGGTAVVAIGSGEEG